jgi:hypothetical protein
MRGGTGSVVLVLDVVLVSSPGVDVDVEVVSSVDVEPGARVVLVELVELDELVEVPSVPVVGLSVVVEPEGGSVVVDGVVVVVVDDSCAATVPTSAPVTASTTIREGRSLFVIVRPAMEPGQERTEG